MLFPHPFKNPYTRFVKGQRNFFDGEQFFCAAKRPRFLDEPDDTDGFGGACNDANA